ncbi:MAG: cytochrome b5 domain-containing protein [Anaerolineales bacterium]
MRVFTLEELSNYNGRDGSPAYIAYRGLVYDVSDSYFFRNGRHWVRHSAGCDLSEEISNAPHDDSLLQNFSVVGTLSPQSGPD